MRKGYLYPIAAIAAAVGMSGCLGVKENGPVAKSVTPADGEPVKLIMYQQIAGISDTEFKEYIAGPVNKKYPNITFELQRAPSGNDGKTHRENLVASGSFPDMVFTNTNSIGIFADLKVPLDMNTVLKEAQIDLSRFDQVALDDIRSYGPKGELFAIPMSVNYSVLFYNKELFDKFGVSYPKDGMMWDQIIELVKKLTRTENGINYYGLDAGPVHKFSSPLSLTYVDAKSKKPLINTEKWQQVFRLGQSIGFNAKDTFLKDRTVAMKAEVIDQISGLEEAHKAGTGFNWDMVSYPNYPDAPGKSLRNVSHLIIVNSAGKHQKEALQALNVIMSDEVQTAMTRKARTGSLKDPKIRAQFGADVEVLKGKNVQAIFKNAPAPNPMPTPYDKAAENRLANAMKDVLDGKSDINTALRNAEDLLSQDIAAMQK